MDRRHFLSLIASAPLAALAPLPKVLAQRQYLRAGDPMLCSYCGVSLGEGTHGIMEPVGDIGVNITCTIPATAESPYWIRYHDIERPEYWYNTSTTSRPAIRS